MVNALSDVLKRRRKELGLTLAQIAERMNVSEATVQRWESGNIKSVRYNKLGALAEVLHVTPSELMGWADTVSPEIGTASSIESDPPRAISLNELKFALWGDTDISDEDLEDVRRYAAFIAERKKK